MSALPPITGEARWRGISLVVALALGQAAAAGIAAFATRDVFAAFRDASTALPVLALGLVASAGIAIALLRFGERVVAEQVGQNYAASLRLKLFRHMTRVSARDLSERRSGALSLRFVGDLAAVRGWVSLGLARMISSLIVLPAATGALFLMNPDLGIAAGIPIAIGLTVLVLAGPRLGPAHKRLRSRRARLAADMSERIPHAPELRLLGRVRTETRQMEDKTEKLIDAALERARGAALLRAIPDAVSGVAAASVFLVALHSGAPGAEAAGALAAVGLMVQPMRDLAGVWDRHRAWRVARDKCAALLAVPKLVGKDQADRQPLANQAQRLRFEAVTSGALSNFSVTAEPGRRIAVIGPNGAGKSTLLSLAAGLELPASGNVTVGGLMATGLTARERRRLIALVGTRSPILAGSMRRALTMGSDDRPDDAAIVAQAQAFGLAQVLDRIGGLDGKVSEAGRNLSAGEIRRVLLTRAALSRPGLLLLDEPDDALDQDGPGLVDQLIRECGATTLVVTHNLEIAASMDEVWVVEDGDLVEVGEPDDGIVTRFVQRQDIIDRVVAAMPA
ncbi:ATP-binding cassette domain-containing protein [Anderseniella sp. Alg231-50]|uniref:ATP-binding cassette domain-containing protein n=1 Tax=Anderseniella sp. Alg231-50 TaxID=1922226 RepID=UPI000D54E649